MQKTKNNNNDIQSGYRDGIWHWKCVMLIKKSGKAKEIDLPSMESIRTLEKKEIKDCRKRKPLDNEMQEKIRNENDRRTIRLLETLLKRSYQRLDTRTIPVMDKGVTQKNWPKIQEMTLAGCIFREKREEEDSPVLKIELIHLQKNSKTTKTKKQKRGKTTVWIFQAKN